MQLNIKGKIKKSIRKMSKFQLVVFCIAFILFALYAFSILYTLCWCVLSSLKNIDDLRLHPFGWPSSFNFVNYTKAFSQFEVEGTKMPVMIFNSIWYSVGGTFVQIACATTLAYVVSKYKFFGRNVIYFIAIFVMVLPIVGALPAQYKLMYNLRIMNSPMILLSFTNGFGFNFIVLYGFFANVSWSYAEAGIMDGASDFKIFFKIMLPQAIPAVLSLFIIAFIAVWNDYQGPILYLSKMPTLSVGLYIYQIEQEINKHILYAGIVLSMIPIFVLFISFQETIMTNTVAGGLKG